MTSFEKQYQRLNKDQKRAVDTIDGPLLVIAGPGTGKTQLLGMRIANILKKTDYGASSILGLSFTNKAAANMKQRLLDLVGPEADAVYIRTFHSFAAEIMSRYPAYFWRGARLAIAPDAVQLEIIQQVLKRLPGGHPLSLRFAGQYTQVKDVQNSINLAKEAGLTPDKLEAIIKANLAYIDKIESVMSDLGNIRVSTSSVSKIEKIVHNLPDQKIEPLIKPLISLGTIIKESFDEAINRFDQTGKSQPLSKWKQRWLRPVDGQYKMAAERRRNEWWLAVSEAYKKYRQQLHRRGYYDYADMLLEVISQIERRPDLRAEIQEQYQYVLIDEFQDTNAAQLRLAHLVADHFSSSGKPNIMAVGDDDQSIFKFQGAELSNMIGFKRNYPSAQIIVLTKNYRSTQPILDSAAGIINHSSYRLVNSLTGLNKDLEAQNDVRKGQINHLSYRSRPEQLDNLASLAIKELNKTRTVAILARSHNSLRDIAAILLQKNASIFYEQSNDIFEKPAIIELMNLLRLVIAIKSGEKVYASQLLSEILPHPMWQLDSKKLWQFAVSQQQNEDWYLGLLNHPNRQFKTIGRWLSELIKISSHQPAVVTIEQAIGLREGQTMTSPLRDFYISLDNLSQEYLETLSALALLRVMASEFGSSSSNALQNFVDLADLMSQNGRILADTTPFQNADKYIELLTVHKAKGLEFDSVIIVDATADQWSPSAYGRLPPANLPLRPAEDDADDYARLMYVAATRARSTLLIGSYDQSIKGEFVPSSILIEHLDTKTMPALSDNKLINVLENSFKWPRLEQVNERQLLKPRLADYSLSVTHLINFLDIARGGPRRFLDRNLLRLPEIKTPSQSLGTAVHSALQLAQNLVNINKFSLDGVIKKFEQALSLEDLTLSDKAKQQAMGIRILKQLFSDLRFKPVKGAQPEYVVSGARIGQAIINGQLDVLQKTETNIIITDYKTGRPLSSLNAKSGDEGLKAWRHKLQLTYYALLVQLQPHFKNNLPLVGQMLYVESRSKKDLIRTYQPNPEELTRLSSLIQIVWQHIMDLNFPDISAYQNSLVGVRQFENDLLSGNI